MQPLQFNLHRLGVRLLTSTSRVARTQQRFVWRLITCGLILTFWAAGLVLAPMKSAVADTPPAPAQPTNPGPASSPGSVSPTVATAKTDYPPGASATISGGGFLAGETVRVQVLHANNMPSTGADHLPWDVTADDHGKFVTAWHVCEDDCVGALLRVSASGQSSALKASSLFTDGPSTFQVFNSVGQGWFDNTANHYAYNANYIAGGNSFYEYRDFFIFDLSSLNLAGQRVVGATVSIIAACESHSGDLTYDLFDVSTPTATLTADSCCSSPSGLAVFDDLGTGQVYGTLGPRTASFQCYGAPFQIVLNAAAINALAAGPQSFSLGGRVRTLDPSGSFIFASSGASPQQLVIETRPADDLSPVARCKDVTVSGGADCFAAASVDNGSFDLNGNAITLTQSPPGPYPVGTTAVTLTVQNSLGLSSTCNASVTVLGPEVACINLAAAGSCLEGQVFLSQPDFSGDITVGAPGSPTALVFEVLNTLCSFGDTFTFYLNGTIVGQTAAGPTYSCTCFPEIQTFTVSDSALIASLWNIAGNNTFRFVKQGNGDDFAWVRVTLQAGSYSKTVCIAEIGGATCGRTYLCSGYTSNPVDQSQTFAEPFVPPVLTTHYQDSLLPPHLDLSSLAAGNYTLCVTGLRPGQSVVQQDCRDFVKSTEQEIIFNGPGNCQEPPNRPPVAKCRNVTVSADNNCMAAAAIDNGSYDPDGDAITLSQNPPGPYSVGSTAVQLTVTDSHGLSSTCQANVSVQGPPAACINLTAAPEGCLEAAIQLTGAGLLEGVIGIEQVIVTGPVTFTKLDSDPDDGSVSDVISANLAITRSYARGVFNVGSDRIEWAAGTTAAPTSPYLPDLVTLRRNGYLPDLVSLPGRDTSLHDITTGAYYDVHWNSWSRGGAGGFSYTRIGYLRTVPASAAYTDSQLPAQIDVTGLPDGNYDLCVSARPALPAPATVTFTKTDGSSAADQISANLVITRGSFGGVFNAGSDQIEWAVGTSAAPTSPFMDFNSLLQNFFRPVDTRLPGSDSVLHDRTTDEYYDVHWLSWSSRGAGGFSYTRVGPVGGAFAKNCTSFTKSGQHAIVINGPGGCVPVPNRPPIVKCEDVTVFAGADCFGTASIAFRAIDPDGNASPATQAPPGPYPIGTTLVTLTMTDSLGLSSSCSANVNVLPPRVACMTFTPSPACLDAQITLSQPDFSGNLTVVDPATSMVLVTHPYDNGQLPAQLNISSLPNGTYSLCVSGIPAGQSQPYQDCASFVKNNQDTIIINGPGGCVLPPNRPPVAKCQDTYITSFDCGPVGASINAGSYDPDDDALTVSQEPPGPYGAGDTFVTLTVTDGLGNSSSCGAFIHVYVSDFIPPTIQCPGDLVVGNDAGMCGAVVNYNVTAEDDCSGVNFVSCSPPPGSMFVGGMTQVFCYGYDNTGNYNNCTFNVTVEDREPPQVATASRTLLYIEAEDFNYSDSEGVNPGQFADFGAEQTLAGKAATMGIDVFDTTDGDDSGGCCGTYRPDAHTEAAKGTGGGDQDRTPRNGRDVTVDWVVGWNNEGEWCNYTRTFPAGDYKIYVRWGSGADSLTSMNAELDEVMSDPTQSDQTVQKIGNFHHDTSTGGWDGFFIFSPLLDDGGQPMRVHLDGKKTLRFTIGPGALDWNYLLFDATPDNVAACPDITISAAQGGCTQVATWNVSPSDNCGLRLPGSELPPGTSTSGFARVADDGTAMNNVLHLTDNEQFSGTGDFTIPDQAQGANLNQIDVHWKSLIGGAFAGVSQFGRLGADGYSFNWGTDLATTGVGENGTGTGLSVTVDTFDNGFTGGEDSPAPGISIKWQGAAVAYDNIDSDQGVAKDFLRKNAFVDAQVTVTPDGLATFTYDGRSISAQLDGWTGIAGGQFVFGARVGSADDNQWIDDFCITAPGVNYCLNFTAPAPPPPCNPPSGSSFPVGTTRVNCTASDNSGNVGSCGFNVVVVDDQPPTIACPGAVRAVASSGQCSAKVTYTAPTVSDNCAGATYSCSPASGATFPTGTTTVACTATDASGNTASCSFAVTVVDTQPPTITCPSNISKNTDYGVCGAIVTWANPSARDNCGVRSVTCSPASGTLFAVGATAVNCTATDLSGNTANCSFTVTVQQASICGKVFYDANANGLDDDGQVVVGWKITLTGKNAKGTITPVIKFTDAGGNYCFDILPGTYTVTESLPNTKWAATTATSGGVSVSSGVCHPGPNFGVVCTQPPTNGLTVGFWSNKNGQNILQAHDVAWRTLLNACNLRNPDGSLYQVPAGAFSTAYGNFRTYLTSLSASNVANILSVQLAATTLGVAYNNLSDSSGLVVPACLVTWSGSNVVKCLKLPLMVGPASVAACSGTNCASANGFITIGTLRAAAKASLGTDANTTKQTPQRGYQECLKVLLDEVNNNGNPPSPSSYNCPLISTLSPVPCPFTSPY